MGTTPPDGQAIDKWLEESGAARDLISHSYVPGKGIHVRAFVVGFTLNSGSHQFAILPGDPTTDQVTARQLRDLMAEFGGVNIRGYDYTEALAAIQPQEMAAPEGTQIKLGDIDNWCAASTS
jgi:hypothetical protein